MQKTLSSNWKITQQFQNLANYRAKPIGVFIEKANHLGFDIIPLKENWK